MPTPIPKNDAALFLGQPIFGDLPSFVASPMVDTPGSIDTFLGNTPGTAPGLPQRCYAVSGKFFGATSSAVQQQINTLAGFANLSGPFGRPTGIRFPDDFRWAPHHCYFRPSEFVPGSITQYPGGQWVASYLLVMRQVNA